MRDEEGTWGSHEGAQTMREVIKDPKRFCAELRRRSKLIKGDHTEAKELMIRCPRCGKDHWWGKNKKHHCDKCGLWVLAGSSHEFISGPHGPMRGGGWFVPMIVISDTKEGLKNKHGTYHADEAMQGRIDSDRRFYKAIAKMRIECESIIEDTEEQTNND
jgi:hypothetical protein